ncbi:MAG: penicillin-binding protein activator [Rickettsiales bacterium]|nr:penicillin-binding protein activator [Rickettsiales bacterium]
MKKVLGFIAAAALAACVQRGGVEYGGYDEYDGMPVENPEFIAGDFNSGDYGSYEDPNAAGAVKTVAVLLPLSGTNAELGANLQHAIEIAFVQSRPRDIVVSFNDIAGVSEPKESVIQRVLDNRPDLIIGPVFAEDVKMLREIKDDALPVISFTTDPSALGAGVFTIGLLPTQGAESIIKQMAADGRRDAVVIAPNNQTGYLMANTAIGAADIYGIKIAGIYYYSENNPEDMKLTAERASLFQTRNAANDKSREILSDILVKEKITAGDRANMNEQLEKLSKRDTVGPIPYDSVLFLGNTNDSKTLASFMRYFDIPMRSVEFYGTPTWDNPSMATDINLAGAKYSALPVVNDDFQTLFADIEKKAPSRMDSFAYDAAMLAINALKSDKITMNYIMNPSGYRGLDGLFRLRPNGVSERALQVLKLNGTSNPALISGAPRNFLEPLYQTAAASDAKPRAREISGYRVQPMDYIAIPQNLRGKYQSAALGTKTARPARDAEPTVLYSPESDADPIEQLPEYQPIQFETIDRTQIDEREI